MNLKKISDKLNLYYQRVKKLYFRVIYVIFKSVVPVRQNHVAFLSDSRSSLSGNFEYIVNEINRRDDPFKMAFALNGTNYQAKSFWMYTKIAWLIGTSKYVLVDDFYPLVYPLKMRKNAELIQVWHAVGAFKKFGFSRVGLPDGPDPKSKNHRNYTKAIVSSKHVAPFYAEGFGIDEDRVCPLGVPRTDLFFDDEKKSAIVQELEEKLTFIQNKKVILFAPTFRGRGQSNAYYPYEWLDFKSLHDALAPLGYVFLFKMHPFVKEAVPIPEVYSDFFYDVSSSREINDLLLTTDLLITDYSSVIFEYSLLKRQSIFFAPDLDEYRATRDFYVKYEDFVPGPITANMPGLIQAIENSDNQSQTKLQDFLDFYFDDLDGQASARFVDALETDFGHLK
ncbi:hypothetical protein WVI01_01830 [Weissella viridescens]|uniref:Ribitolphosphotransferase n=2 Tax=Weissella viridescens TaxID=1629 RepID=A0A0R2H8J1_WEIVI|nr:CDP-glycerol glycerophosphotransferase family protein [Weissella viridescens]KRN46917.1 ribitolphosphotransferase [Weissella viridescens]GEA94260.1 hypothetical protein WVI01_01830 [Weissella viridescens]